MNKKIVIGCFMVTVLLTLSFIPSAVGFQTLNQNEINNNKVINLFKNLRETTDGWHLGFFIELIIGTIFLLLILIGILTPSEVKS